MKNETSFLKKNTNPFQRTVGQYHHWIKKTLKKDRKTLKKKKKKKKKKKQKKQKHNKAQTIIFQRIKNRY